MARRGSIDLSVRGGGEGTCCGGAGGGGELWRVWLGFATIGRHEEESPASHSNICLATHVIDDGPSASNHGKGITDFRAFCIWKYPGGGNTLYEVWE